MSKSLKVEDALTDQYIIFSKRKNMHMHITYSRIIPSAVKNLLVMMRLNLPNTRHTD